MKSPFITILIIILFSSTAFSQYVWQVQNSGTNRELTGVSFIDENTGWISGWTGTIIKTTDGGQNWNTLPNVPPNNAYYSVFFTDAQNGWASGYAGKIIHTQDGGDTWISQSNSDVSDLYRLFFINADTGWAAGGIYGGFPSNIDDRTILNTTNGGSTWTLQYGQAYEAPLKSIFFIDKNNGFATGSEGVLMRTTDGGNNWSVQTINSSFTFYDVFFTDYNNGFVVGEDLNLPHVSAIFKTTDSGNSWTQTTLGNDEIISGIYFPSALNGWAVGNNWGNGNIGVIYYTSDRGENWSIQNTPAIDALAAVFFIDNTAGWAAGHLGTIVALQNQVPVELTSFTARADNGSVVLGWRTATETNNKGFEIMREKSEVRSQMSEWEKIGFVGGNGTTTKENSYTYRDKNLLSGKYSYKLVQVDFDGTRNESEVVNVEINTQPEDYALMQNYPNPFNPTTTIGYSIPEDRNVKLEIFNALGEEISTLVNVNKQAGTHSIEFDASKLSSGIYYYRIKSGDFSQIKKMILLK